MNLLEPWPLLIMAAVLLCLLAAKRWPDSARFLGRSVHVLKKPLPDGAEPAARGLTAPGDTTRPRSRMARHAVDPAEQDGWRY